MRQSFDFEMVNELIINLGFQIEGLVLELYIKLV